MEFLPSWCWRHALRAEHSWRPSQPSTRHEALPEGSVNALWCFVTSGRQTETLCTFALSTGLWISFFFLPELQQPLCPWQLDLIFQLFINEFSLILWCLIPFQRHEFVFSREACVCLRGHDSPPFPKLLTREAQMASWLRTGSQDTLDKWWPRCTFDESKMSSIGMVLVLIFQTTKSLHYFHVIQNVLVQVSLFLLTK